LTPPPSEATAIERPSGLIRVEQVSLGRAFRSVAVPHAGSFWRKLGAFTGPGYLVAIGYMDPGNWATDIAGGSRFGYDLLCIILLSNVMAMVLQSLSAKLGIATGKDLAQACRARYSRPVRLSLWLLCEAAIVACDLAEVIGTAIALQLLFGIPLLWGVCLTGANVLIILSLERYGFRKLEAVIAALMLVTGACLAIELLLAQPDLGAIAAGFMPKAAVITNPAMLYIAIGIIGATVMPHNLYLHSAMVQTRRFRRDDNGKREAIRFATIDSVIALTFALAINAAILILAASAFHDQGRQTVSEIGEAYHLLAPMLGASAASILFGVALLASGQNSSVTGTLAGQVVMEGFTDLKLPVWTRRIVSRLLAIVPAAIVAVLYGEAGTGRLLILSQVILSLQLPFAMVPLVRLTGDKRLMGNFANGKWLGVAAWLIAACVILLNLKLLSDIF
jgi:manganese transport protein